MTALSSMLSFALAETADASSYCVLHRAPGTDAWIEVTSFVDRIDRSVALRANITAGGIYALAHLEK